MGHQKTTTSRSITLAVIILTFGITSCTYPFASFSSKKILPESVGKPWSPPRRAKRTAAKIKAKQTIDPAIFEGEISLAESITFALENNPDTSISFANLEESIAKLGIARSDSFPSIEVETGVARTRTGVTFPPRILIFQWLTTWASELNITYTLWDFGARVAKNQSALQALFAMAWSYNQEVQTVVQTVTNAYYDNLFQKATLANDHQNVQDALLILDSAEKKLHVGVGNVTQLVQAKTNYLQKQVDLVDQKNNAATSLAQLATDMGMPGNIAFHTQNFPNELPGQEYIANLNDLIDLAVENRPSIISKKAQINAKKAAVTQARLNTLPKVETAFNATHYDYNNFYNSHFNYSGQFNLTFPFFNGFQYRNEVRQAKAQLKEAEALLKKEQDDALQQVTVAFVSYRNAIDRVGYSTAFLDSALEEFDVTLSNYRVGTGDIIDVMQAQTSLSDARTKYTVSVKDLFVSLTNLAYSTGSLIAPAVDSSWDSIYQFEDDTYE